MFMELKLATNLVCPRCSGPFICDISAGAKSCWCMSFLEEHGRVKGAFALLVWQ